MIGLDLSDECAANGCRLRIGPPFSDPEPIIVCTLAPAFLDRRSRRSCEHKYSRVGPSKGTRKVFYLRWIERILAFYDTLSHRRQPMPAQTGSCVLIVGATAETTHQMK